MERKEVLVTDLQKVLGSEYVSSHRQKDKWQAIPYSADEIQGVILHANRAMTVPDLVFDPQLTGYYDIYVGMYITAQFTQNKLHEALLKLSSDANFAAVSPNAWIGNHKIDEFRWRSVDMTGETITIRHPQNTPGYAFDTSIAFFRFVPLTSEQFAARKAEFADQKNKKVFATNDIHCFMYKYNPQTREEWQMVVDEYLNSDVESLSMEYWRKFDTTFDEYGADYPFQREQDRNVFIGLKKFILPEDNVYPSIIKRGHEIGLKMYMSLRMGAWGIEFPMDNYFSSSFFNQHPELRCLDRDGTEINRLSYAYPEVREHILDCLNTMLSYGSDGVSLLYTRGVPYVLFEEPIQALFAKEYPGVDCRMLPNTDPRLIRVRSQVMTDFMRSVRELADSYGKDKKVNVHVHTSLKDNLYYALDVEQWIKEGLVDNIIVNNDYHWENLDADVWSDEDKTLIDLEKYKKWANSSPEIITCRNVYGHLIPKGAVAEYLSLVEGTSIRVFCDLQRDTPEEAKKEALRLLDMGIKDICIWDTWEYKPNGRLWEFCSRLGHIDQIADFDINNYAKIHRVNALNNMQVGRYCPWWGG